MTRQRNSLRRFVPLAVSVIVACGILVLSAQAAAGPVSAGRGVKGTGGAASSMQGIPAEAQVPTPGRGGCALGRVRTAKQDCDGPRGEWLWDGVPAAYGSEYARVTPPEAPAGTATDPASEEGAAGKTWQRGGVAGLDAGDKAMMGALILGIRRNPAALAFGLR